jgi:hypothetical protein
MKSHRFSLLHPLLPAVALLAGLILALSMTSAKALPAAPAAPDAPATAPGAIEGFVYAPDGTTPIVGARVNMHHEEAHIDFSAETVAGGYYSNTNLLPGPYMLHARPPAGSPFASSLPKAVEIVSGGWAAENLLLTDPLISGYVRDCGALPELRIPGASVVAHTADWSFEVWDSTNPNGEFKLGGMATGVPIILEVLPPPESEYVRSEPIEVVPPAAGLVLELCIPPTNVVGTIHNPAGLPVPGAGVVLWHDEFWTETAADELGGFRFRGLPTGTFWLQAAPPWGPAGAGLLPSPPFTVSVPLPDTLVDVGVINLPPAVKTVSGRVLNAATGLPVDDALVVAHRLDEPGFADRPVEANGVFTLYLPGGEWHLRVEPLPPPTPPAEWIFLGPAAWVPFIQPPDVPEDIPGVILEVVPTNAWVEGQVLCPGEPGPVPCDGPPFHLSPADISVELRNDQFRNRVGLGPDFRFAMPIIDGWYELMVHVHHPELPLQGPPLDPILVPPNQHLVLPEPIVLAPKDALIVGQVRNELGVGVPGVVLVGWQPEGFGWGWAATDASGTYTMPVIGGEWFVEPHPGPELPFVYRYQPQLVGVAPRGKVAGVNFELSRAEARITGSAVDAVSGEPLWGLDGWAWAERHVVGDVFEFFSDAPMRDSRFELKVRGDAVYNVGLDLPPHAPYVSGGAGPIAVPPFGEKSVEVPLQHKDAAIEGTLVVAGTSPADPALGVWAEVFGEDEQGHWVIAGVDPDTAGYALGVISGTWHLRTWVDPASGYVALPTPTAVNVHSGAVASFVDFEVWPINTFISGTVAAPDGTPVEAFVFAEGESPFVGHFETHTWSGPDGRFELLVPEGGYVVGAGLPGDELQAMGWLNPPPIDVPWVAAGSPATGLELHFRRWDGEIHGTITFAPGVVATATHPAYVWGRTASGDWSETEAMPAGVNTFTYTLRVISGTIWHVGAVYEDVPNGVFYESPEELVPVPPTPPVAQAFQDLELGGPWMLPQPFIVSFDGTQMQTIVMPDGVELVIPPGALVNAGTVTLFIFPTRELRPEPGSEIIGVGYEIWAIDQNGQQITHFNKNVIMTFHYPPDAELAQQGVSEYRLVPVYYSTLAGHWILADSYVVDTEHNEITLQINHFTRFATLSTESKQPQIFLPLVMRHGP